MEIILVILKYLAGSVLTFFAFVSADPSAGWFPVEKVQVGADQLETTDLSIWVLFAKNLGKEKILVRFPNDPSYQYMSQEVLSISADREGETFQLIVQPAILAAPSEDLFYQSEGKWVREHFVQTADHLFHFKTLCNEPDSVHHKAFVSSFLIEKNS